MTVLVQTVVMKATSGTSLAGTFGAPVGADNAVAIAIGSSQGTANPTVSAASLGGTAFTKASAVNAGGGDLGNNEQWILANAPAGQTALSVTFNAGSGTNQSMIGIGMEFSAMATSGLLDRAPAGGSGNSNTWTSGSTGTLSTASQVIIGAVYVAFLVTPTLTTPGSPWTELTQQSNTSRGILGVGYQIVSATTAQTYNGTLSGSDPWTSTVISLEQAGAAPAVNSGAFLAMFP